MINKRLFLAGLTTGLLLPLRRFPGDGRKLEKWSW